MTTSHDHDGADLRATMDSALHGLTAPDRCGPAAIRAGRRIRTRRRAGYAVSGIAAVAAISTLSLSAYGGDTASETTDYAATPTPSSPQATPPDGCGTGTPSEAPTSAPPADPPAGWWQTPADQVLATLEELVPANVTVRPERSDTGYADGVLAGPEGPGSFQLMLRPPPADIEPQQVTTTTDADADANTTTHVCGGEPDARSRLTCQPDDPDWTGEYLACAFIRDEDGAKIGAISTERDRGTTYHNVTLIGPEGGSIYLYVADSTGEKPGSGPPTADEPPLTFAEVRALVQNPAWTSDRP